jgi:hypothetical protein
MMGMRTPMAAVVSVMLVAGCQDADDAIAFDGFYFRTSLKSGDDPRVFAVTSFPVSASIEGARQAAQYEAFTYCINEYGSSKIKWTVGPKQDPASYRIVDDTLTLSGVCPG